MYNALIEVESKLCMYGPMCDQVRCVIAPSLGLSSTTLERPLFLRSTLTSGTSCISADEGVTGDAGSLSSSAMPAAAMSAVVLSAFTASTPAFFSRSTRDQQEIINN